MVVLPGEGERRVAIVASLGVAGRRYSVATTHLSLDPAVARRQLRVGARRAGPSGPSRGCWRATCNLLPAQVDRLADVAGFDLVDGAFTVNARTRPNRRLDHVLLDGASATASGVTKLPCSDHLAVWADVR